MMMIKRKTMKHEDHEDDEDDEDDEDYEDYEVDQYYEDGERHKEA